MMITTDGTVRDAEISALKTKYENEIKELRILLKYYEEQFRLLKKRQFSSSSEKSSYDQLRLDIDEIKTIISENIVTENDEEESDTHTVKGHKRRKRTRKEMLPEGLPVEEIICELSEEERLCPDCGVEMNVIGHTHREEIVVIPAKVEIRRYSACTYVCKECDEAPVIKARLPNSVIKGSNIASPEFIAYTMHQKFTMGIPLYRQEQEWLRQGIELSRQTMANWLIHSTERWLMPLFDELKKQLLLSGVLHGDETTLQVLREPGKTPQSNSYLWCYRTSGDTDNPIVLAEYKPDRKTHNPSIFLKGFKGYLHTDGYEAYHKLPSGIIVVGCWAHVRRKWDEALKVVPKENRKDCAALIGKRYCDKLFAIERELADRGVENRFKERLKRLQPLMEEFFVWAFGLDARPKSTLGRAITYMASQKRYLMNVLLDGRLELSNNRVERTIKPFVICRKNFLFANTPQGAVAAATIFSLIETAKENGLNPFEYLTYVFRLAPNIDINDPENIRLLLPAGYKKFIKPESL
ncbi:MAG: IS66 family transposase [Syntrophobacterales bacterium]|jgi:transposase|nr:IS66 family transposase [Syntrophobacterales bacterium]